MDLWKHMMRFFTFMLLLVYTTTMGMDPQWKKSRWRNVTQIRRWNPSRYFDDPDRVMLLSEPSREDPLGDGLEYHYYRESCPQVERRIIQEYFYRVRPRIIPSLLRLSFHDCFVEGCDASILLDPVSGMASEKDASPNELLKASYDVIDAIKFETERVCPRIVSCADILVLAAREAILTARGSFYPLQPGRRDKMISYAELAEYQLPSPFSDLSETLVSSGSRGSDERDTVDLDDPDLRRYPKYSAHWYSTFLRGETVGPNGDIMMMSRQNLLDLRPAHAVQ
ncbi:hypothetical protein CRG98_046581 [Punica granatum]|uniref:Peroxidase n=1 Tax=Punica granatum TaxID=22663 RepID=A0A2I0HMS6_PUNGR|nr:hypothetical protein CRG98_046581 [Punica granatum]